MKFYMFLIRNLPAMGKLFGDEVPTRHKGEVSNLNRSPRATCDRCQKMLLQIGPPTKQKSLSLLIRRPCSPYEIIFNDLFRI
jgi:hypothetical protein